MSGLLGKAVAEGVGTTILVFFAVGAAVFGGDRIGAAGVAIAFGFTLLALVYAIGPVSGCHVNPAVTLGVLLRKGISVRGAAAYWAAQTVGGILGAGGIQLLLSAGGVADQTGTKGANNWGPSINAGGAFILEVFMTFLLVMVVLLVTARSAAPGFAGLAIGVTLTAVHLVGIPLDGTSVNPARSLGPALFAGGQPLSHLWLFLLGPLVGAAAAALTVPLLQLSTGAAPAAVRVAPAGADLPEN